MKRRTILVLVGLTLILALAFLGGTVLSPNSAPITPELAWLLPNAPATPIPSITPIVTPTFTRTPRPPQTPRPSATLLPSLTSRPSRTPRPTESPLPTATPVILYVPEPSKQDLIKMMSLMHPRNPEFDELFYSGLSYQMIDVDHNSQAEIVIHGGVEPLWLSYLVILAFDARAGGWRETFYLDKDNVMCGGTQVIAQPQFLDFRYCSGSTGTGGGALTYSSAWIQCLANQCREIFSYPIVAEITRVDYEWVQETHQETNAYLTHVSRIESIDDQQVVVVSENFGTIGVPDYCCRRVQKTTAAILPSFHGETIREIHRWNGTRYFLAEKYPILSALLLGRDPNPIVGALNQRIVRILANSVADASRVTGDSRKAGLDAAIAQFWNVATDNPRLDPLWGRDMDTPLTAATDKDRVAIVIGNRIRDVCRVNVQQFTSHGLQRLGTLDIGCLAELARVTWLDIDGDGSKELLFTSIVNQNNQSLHIYRVTDSVQEIGKLFGTINGSDGVGVRWDADARGVRFYEGMPFTSDQANPVLPETPVRRWKTYRWNPQSQSLVAE